MKKDPRHGGTNADGSSNTDYCSYCYKFGAFRPPEVDTAQKMQTFCIGKMKEAGTPAALAWVLTRSIPRLKRWRTR